MKKTIIILGAIAVVFLMISSATAIPTTQSQTVTNIMNAAKQRKADDTGDEKPTCLLLLLLFISLVLEGIDILVEKMMDGIVKIADMMLATIGGIMGLLEGVVNSVSELAFMWFIAVITLLKHIRQQIIDIFNP